jgi:beta-lactamase class D
LSRAQTPYVPASTFKMLNALIGLEHGWQKPALLHLRAPTRQALSTRNQ